MVESLAGSSILAAVVFDGFGLKTFQSLGSNCPNFEKIFSLRCAEIRSVDPPKTPVAFASMATGLSPANHGIRSKEETLDSETVFDVLGDEDMRTCVGGRLSGSPAHLFGDSCDYPAIAHSNRDEEVLELTLEAIETRNPAFTMVQFLDIDKASHKYGPFGDNARKAVRDTDMRLGALVRVLGQIGGAVIVLADHGQHERRVIEDGKKVLKGTHDGSCELDYMIPLGWCDESEVSRISET